MGWRATAKISGRGPFVCAAWLVIAASGCGPSGDNAGRAFEGIRSGTPLEQVEAAIGSGREVSYEQLSETARIVIKAKGPGVTYKVWVREEGQSKATLSAGFMDGKLTSGPVIETNGPMSMRIGGS